MSRTTYRKTVGQALGGVAVLLGAGFAYLQFSQQQRASHDLLISNQVSKGFEQLGSEKVVVRLGGIYALEGVMNSSDQYHQAVLEALSAFVREGAKLPATPPTAEAADGPKAAHGHPSRAHSDRKALGWTRGRRFNQGEHPRRLPVRRQSARRHPARRQVTWRRQPVLRQPPRRRSANANLSDADLTGANLHRADLTHALLPDANLSKAHLIVANLTTAFLFDANLTGANLTNANLTNAYLFNANLRAADLTGADLTGADLSSADLSSAVLDQKQLDEACGWDAKLPTGLTLKPCPPPSSP